MQRVVGNFVQPTFSATMKKDLPSDLILNEEETG